MKRYGMPLRGMDRIRREAAPRLPPQRGRCREATVGVPPIGLRPLPPEGEAGAAEGVSPCGGDVACLPNGGGVAKRRWGFPLSAFGHFPLWGKQGLLRASALAVGTWLASPTGEVSRSDGWGSPYRPSATSPCGGSRGCRGRQPLRRGRMLSRIRLRHRGIQQYTARATARVAPTKNGTLSQNSEFRTPNSELHCRPSEQNRDGTLIRTIPVFLSKKRKAENGAHATSHLYFSTLYSGTKGSRMGTVLTYFWYSGSLP